MLILRKVCVVLMSVLLTVNVAEAKPKKQKTKHAHNAITHTISRTETTLVADAHTGTVLYSENANRRIYPASLTKMMTLYLAFDALKHKQVSMQTMLPVSARAQSARPSKLGLVKGQKISMGDAVMGMIVKSANDAAVTVAENLGGSEPEFAHKMNAKAKELGMEGTHFTNASGWHDSHQVTTAIDMAKLGLALKRNFPEYYPWFKKTSFAFHGKVISGHNHVLKQYAGSEGLKTGFTGPAGFNLVTTASKNGMSLIGVVTGRSSAKVRDAKMMALLDQYFGVEKKQVRYTELGTHKKVAVRKKPGHKNVKLAGNGKGAKKHSKRV